MAGVAALLLSLRALSGRAGFLRRLAGSLTAGRNRQVNPEAAGRLLAGLTSGFALALPLSAIPFSFIGYAAGAAALIAAVVLKIAANGKSKGVVRV
jgi:hypothetical protein